MANTIKIKRRPASGAAGKPSSLYNGELAFNENDNILYYGYGSGVAGAATSIEQVGGSGYFAHRGGINASGLWPVSITGNAATVTSGVTYFGTPTTGYIPKFTDTDTIENGYQISTDLSINSSSSYLPRADAVKTYVDNLLGANDAMIFKGTIGTGGTITALPTTYSAGWTYRVITAGTYAGKVCEVGDLIIAVIDRSGSGNDNSDWTVAQNNLDGAVIGPSSATDSGFALFDGATGKIIKDAGYTTIPVNKGGTGQTSYTDGQLLIGNSTGNTLTKATLTAGTSIDVTNGGGSITVAHADTSSLSGAQGSNGIASITVDGLGHVTAVTTATYLTSATVCAAIVDCTLDGGSF